MSYILNVHSGMFYYYYYIIIIIIILLLKIAKSRILRPKKYNFKIFFASLSCDYLLYTSKR